MYPWTMSQSTELEPCPRCGKPEGEFIDSGRTRFRYYVTCKACPFMTDLARTSAIAVKLWNEAKPENRGKGGGVNKFVI